MEQSTKNVATLVINGKKIAKIIGQFYALGADMVYSIVPPVIFKTKKDCKQFILLASDNISDREGYCPARYKDGWGICRNMYESEDGVRDFTRYRATFLIDWDATETCA